jgi:AcrR family transcriptional regulator
MNYVVARGRRPGKPDTRAEILRIAAKMFFANGYDGVTLRAIADEAGVDVALVSYYFGSKKGVFGAVLQLTANPAEIVGGLLGGDPRTLARRLLSAGIAAWDDPVAGRPLVALIRSAAHDVALATVVREGVQREIVDKLADTIGGRDARRRASLFCSQMVGLIYARYVIGIEPLASMSGDELVRMYAPVMATLLHPVPQGGVRRAVRG